MVAKKGQGLFKNRDGKGCFFKKIKDGRRKGKSKELVKMMINVDVLT